MPLTIVTNERYFYPDRLEPEERHLGTRDRYDASKQFDYPGKAVGCLNAARMLQHRTLREGGSTIFGPLVDGHGNSVFPISWLSSNRVPSFRELEHGHDTRYLSSLVECVAEAKENTKSGRDPFIKYFGKEADITPGTLDAARLAVGAAYDTIDTILDAPTDNTAFALVWPPGHHAERNLAMGFCYLSNAALAALYARDHKFQVRPGYKNRIVLIDIDHHRGNGTASVLANQPDTLFIDVSYRSPYDEIRQRFTDGEYDPARDRFINSGNEYPYSRPDTDWGLEAHTMTAAPNIVSIEFEGEQTPDAIMDRFFSEVVPRVQSFCPDVILWSVGLDSAMGDPLGGLGNLPSSFYSMIRCLRIALPVTRQAGLLEGGYDELRWFTCLPAVLMAFHEHAKDSKNRCRAFGLHRTALDFQR